MSIPVGTAAGCPAGLSLIGWAGDAISKVMPGSGNQGGFRAAGTGDDKKFVVLYTSGEDREWPDHLDLNTGQFVYFGDNKTPGHELHETRRGGNRILRRVLDLLHAEANQRALIPPFFIFKKCLTSNARDYRGSRVRVMLLAPVSEVTRHKVAANLRALLETLDIHDLPVNLEIVGDIHRTPAGKMVLVYDASSE
jgi:hypothetical protein